MSVWWRISSNEGNALILTSFETTKNIVIEKKIISVLGKICHDLLKKLTAEWGGGRRRWEGSATGLKYDRYISKEEGV